MHKIHAARETQTYKKLDSYIVWNVHNTVFGSKHAQLQFRHVAVVTFVILVCCCFNHTLTSSGHAHLDHQSYNMACRVTCEWALDIEENLE